jgi:CubicO group peptidase (beta-lactamase class C family)
MKHAYGGCNPTMIHGTAVLVVLAALSACGDDGPVATTEPPLSAAIIVDAVRANYHLPALAGAIVTIDRLDYARAVSGSRRAVGGTSATLEDLWHLGSNFKAFTGMLAAIAVDRGELSWNTTIAEAFPELAGSIHADYSDVTLRELLAHTSGVPRDPDPSAIIGATRTDQRAAVAAWALVQPPVTVRGRYSYTNAGYMIAAAMVERALDAPFEDAMATHVFGPLGIGDAGFGPQAAHGTAAQPIAHVLIDGQWVARENFDNPPVYASAGGAHMSVDSWSRFLQEVLRLEAGQPRIVSTAAGVETTASIAVVSPTATYGLGWLITSRDWANGRALTHDGSNTANHSLVWVAPGRGFAVLAVTNAYDGSSSAITWQALNAAVGRLIQLYETGG